MDRAVFELRHHVERIHCVGDDGRLAHEFLGIGLAALQIGIEHVLGLDDADDDFRVAVRDGDARMDALGDRAADLDHRVGQIDDVDIVAGRHHGPHRAVAELHDARDHLALVHWGSSCHTPPPGRGVAVILALDARRDQAVAPGRAALSSPSRRRRACRACARTWAAARP